MENAGNGNANRAGTGAGSSVQPKKGKKKSMKLLKAQEAAQQARNEKLAAEAAGAEERVAEPAPVKAKASTLKRTNIVANVTRLSNEIRAIENILSRSNISEENRIRAEMNKAAKIEERNRLNSELTIYKEYNKNINRMTVPYEMKPTNRTFLTLNAGLVAEYKSLDEREYSSLSHTEKKRYRTLFLEIINHIITKLVYDPVKTTNGSNIHFLDYMNNLIETHIFNNKSVVFKKYIKQLIYIGFMKNITLINEQINVELEKYNVKKRVKNSKETARAMKAAARNAVRNGEFVNENNGNGVNGVNSEELINPLDFKIELQLREKIDQFTNYMENYLTKSNESLVIDDSTFLYPEFYLKGFSNKGSHYPSDYLAVPFSDIFDFQGQTTLNQVRNGSEAPSGAGAGSRSEEEKSNSSITFRNTFNYIIKNYFYGPIDQVAQNRRVPSRREDILNNHLLRTDSLIKIYNNIKSFGYNIESPNTKLSDNTIADYMMSGKMPFVINNKYIMHIPIPFTVKTINETYGGDYGGLTKTFFDNINNEINQIHINENNSDLSIIKNEKISANILSEESGNGVRRLIPESPESIPNKNKVHKKIAVVSAIENFFKQKILEQNTVPSKYTFMKRKISYEMERVPVLNKNGNPVYVKNANGKNTNRKKMTVARKEVITENPVLQLRDSDYVSIITNMITSMNGSKIKNTFNLQILLFTVILVLICSISRETRIRRISINDIRRMNVKILLNKNPNGSLSLAYKIILAYYILNLKEEYKKSSSKILVKDQFDEYLFYLTLFYDNKDLYNFVITKNEVNLRYAYTVYRKGVTNEQAEIIPIDTIIEYLKDNYVNLFTTKYTSEIGLTTFNTLLRFYGYENIEVFMKEHLEGSIVNKQHIIDVKQIRNEYLYAQVPDRFFNNVITKFINSLTPEQLNIYSKFISGTLLKQPYYHYDLERVDFGNRTKFRSYTCHNTHLTLLVQLTPQENIEFNNLYIQNGRQNEIDRDVDPHRRIIDYNLYQKALYKLYIINKDQTISIMEEGISSFGYT